MSEADSVCTLTNGGDTFSFRPVLAPGEGEGGKTPAEDPTGPPARSAEEPQRGWYTYKGTVQHFILVSLRAAVRYACCTLTLHMH